jgi:hypothetical protein
VGFAFVTFTVPATKLCRASKYASIFTGESMAIIVALEEIKQTQDKNFSIF